MIALLASAGALTASPPMKGGPGQEVYIYYTYINLNLLQSTAQQELLQTEVPVGRSNYFQDLICQSSRLVTRYASEGT